MHAALAANQFEARGTCAALATKAAELLPRTKVFHMISHWNGTNDSSTPEWLRECIAAETEEATVRLPVLAQDFSIADEVLRMSREEIEDALVNEFNEARAA